MINRSLTYVICVIGTIVMLGLPANSVSAEERDPTPPVDSIGNRPAIAVLPFANFTGEQEAMVLVPMIEQAFSHNGFFVLRSARIRQTLRQHRIRTAGLIGSEDANLVASAWGVNYLLLGSLDMYKDDAIPEAGFSVRLLEVSTMQVIWARTVAATGSDFTGLFGLGRITEMPRLLRKLVYETVEGARQYMDKFETGETPEYRNGKLAVVIFDNQSSNRRAGEIVSSMVLSQLWKDRIRVVEPGVVVEEFRRHRRLARGQIMFDVLEALRTKYEVDLVLTGAVDEYLPGRPSATRSFPRLQLGGRLVDARAGLVVAAEEYYREGSDSELILGLGAKRALGDLASEVLDDLVHELLDDTMDKYAERR